jgi:hypothetical protein
MVNVTKLNLSIATFVHFVITNDCWYLYSLWQHCCSMHNQLCAVRCKLVSGHWHKQFKFWSLSTLSWFKNLALQNQRWLYPAVWYEVSQNLFYGVFAWITSTNIITIKQANEMKIKCCTCKNNMRIPESFWAVILKPFSE